MVFKGYIVTSYVGSLSAALTTISLRYYFIVMASGTVMVDQMLPLQVSFVIKQVWGEPV